MKTKGPCANTGRVRTGSGCVSESVMQSIIGGSVDLVRGDVWADRAGVNGRDPAFHGDAVTHCKRKGILFRRHHGNEKIIIFGGPHGHVVFIYQDKQVIGVFERIIILVLSIFNAITAVAIIITVKTWARSNDIKTKEGFGNKYLIGTLVSISLALIAAYFWYIIK